MTTAPLLSQPAERLNLGWVEGDLVDLRFKARAVDWSGDYTAQVRRKCDPISTLIGTLTVTAVLNGLDTDFALTMSAADSALVKHGDYFWDMQETGGVTRFSGKVTVGCQVTVPV